MKTIKEEFDRFWKKCHADIPPNEDNTQYTETRAAFYAGYFISRSALLSDEFVELPDAQGEKYMEDSLDEALRFLLEESIRLTHAKAVARNIGLN